MKRHNEENVHLRRKCLELISSIATKGARHPGSDTSRCAMRLLAYGIARYNYNNPDMGPTRARKELEDLEKMHSWLESIDSEGREKRSPASVDSSRIQ